MNENNILEAFSQFLFIKQQACCCKSNVCVFQGEDGAVDVKMLHDKLRHTESKLADYRNQCQVLKQEVKIQNKVTRSPT